MQLKAMRTISAIGVGNPARLRGDSGGTVRRGDRHGHGRPWRCPSPNRRCVRRSLQDHQIAVRVGKRERDWRGGCWKRGDSGRYNRGVVDPWASASGTAAALKRRNRR